MSECRDRKTLIPKSVPIIRNPVHIIYVLPIHHARFRLLRKYKVTSENRNSGVTLSLIWYRAVNWLDREERTGRFGLCRRVNDR
jgi:hypothetical protein